MKVGVIRLIDTSQEKRITKTNLKTFGQILICSAGCCCGKTDKGAPPIPVEWLQKSWKQFGLQRSIHLTITGCLGPCDLTNVICIITKKEQIWLGSITENTHYEELLEWCKASVDEGYLLEIPSVLKNHIFDRFLS